MLYNALVYAHIQLKQSRHTNPYNKQNLSYMVHELKTWPNYFSMVFCGSKNFEVRKDDRNFKLGDELLLKEWDNEKECYTGRFLHRRVDYILKGGQFGIEEGYVILSISKI